MAAPRHPKKTQSKVPKTTGLSVAIEEEATSAQQQLFSFPKPPTHASPSSPHFHLRLDTDSRRGSHRLETPPLTAESSPSFATFLKRRPSTSISGTDVTAQSLKTVLATSTGSARPGFHPVGTPQTQLRNDTNDDLVSGHSPASQIEEAGDSFGTKKPHLSARTAPLFFFLRNAREHCC